MKFSEQWLRTMVDPPIGTAELCEKLTMAGLEVESAMPAAPSFSGVVVAKIETVEPHPNADRLHVCRVDIGVAEHIEFIFFERLAVGVGGELAFDLFVDVLPVLLDDHVARRLAGTEAGKRGLFLIILGDGRKGFVHLLRLDFDAHEFFARSQIFYGYVHRQAFQLLAGNRAKAE